MSLLQRSIKHEYELYIDCEIEAYKESLSRHELLRIGDEAAAALAAQAQLALTELLLCEEVDRIIRRRLRLPAYATWRRRRLKALSEMRRPERWGLRPDDALASSIPDDGHVLVAGADERGPTLFLAAKGCEVTALNPIEDAVERVMFAAAEVGLTSRVRGFVADVRSWQPDTVLSSVICSAGAFEGMTSPERGQAISVLQDATRSGGLHLVETPRDGGRLFTFAEFQEVYPGWSTSVERANNYSETFLARKIGV